MRAAKSDLVARLPDGRMVPAAQLRRGDEVIVQIAKEPMGTKGARITTHITLPGRYMVFMPTVDHVGVSRKIESREERSRLKGGAVEGPFVGDQQK